MTTRLVVAAASFCGASVIVFALAWLALPAGLIPGTSLSDGKDALAGPILVWLYGTIALAVCSPAWFAVVSPSSDNGAAARRHLARIVRWCPVLGVAGTALGMILSAVMSIF